MIGGVFGPWIVPQSSDCAEGPHLREIKIDHDHVGSILGKDHVVAHEANHGSKDFTTVVIILDQHDFLSLSHKPVLQKNEAQHGAMPNSAKRNKMDFSQRQSDAFCHCFLIMNWRARVAI